MPVDRSRISNLDGKTLMHMNKSQKYLTITGKRNSPAENHEGCLYGLPWPVKHIIYAILLSLFLTLPFSECASAKPVGQPEPQNVVKVAANMPSSIPSETTGTASTNKQKSSSNSSSTNKANKHSKPNIVAKPKSGSADKFLVGEYDDPGKPQKKASFFINLLYTIIDIIKYGFYLGLVLAVGFLAIYGIKLFTTRYNAITGGGQELINILEVKYIAPGKAVCLLEVGGKILVLGIAGNSINSLCELDDSEQVDALRQVAANKVEPLQPFQALLDKFTNRFMHGTAKQPKRPARPAKRQQDVSVKSEANWHEELHSTGDNIRKLLEEIKEQDKKTGGQKRPPKRNRGEENK